MQLLDLTLDSPAANLALDEALLDAVTAGELAGDGVLRFWEAPRPLVVVGRASRLADEVHQDRCECDAVPVLRRASGGMAIVAGPGCLMYAVVARHPTGSADIPRLHQQVLAKLSHACRQLDLDVAPAGTSDLTIADTDGGRRKVSGNSLRVTREAFLYHGTLLCDFDLALIDRYLRQPPRAPDYRAGRRHHAFVANLPATRGQLVATIARAWQADKNGVEWPRERVDQLVRERYASDHWNAAR